MMDLKKEILIHKRFEEVFAFLRQKAKEEPFRNKRAPVYSDLPLDWVLRNEKQITKQLLRLLKKEQYVPDAATRSIVCLDKEREIYSVAWPDHIVEAVLAQCLQEAIEPTLSESLYSFRKGRSNTQAVKAFAETVESVQGQTLYILKRDVRNYGDSVDINILVSKIVEVLGPQDPYSLKLLRAFLSPEVRGDSHAPGLAAGFRLTPICENLYLSDLDRRLEHQGAFYARFGDDILFADPSLEQTLKARSVLHQVIQDLQLEFKQEKLQDCIFAEAAKASEFKSVQSINYLGYNIDRQGQVFLSDEKVKKLQDDIRKTARQAFLSYRKLSTDETDLVNAVVRSISVYFERELRHPYFTLLLTAITNTDRLKCFDTWIAKIALRNIFKTSHDRVFRYLSYKTLRSMGLPSLVHLRRRALRGAC